ncbi:MAG: hypothetical protein ACJZ9F_03420 [Rhodospirillaceae bacterium]
MTTLRTKVGLTGAIILAILTITVNIVAQELKNTGRPQWQSYDTRLTKGARVTHAATLSHEGLIYAANDAGLLAFDGLEWRRFNVGPERKPIQALAYLGNEKWLVGGEKALGTFAPDSNGTLIWNDIISGLPKQGRPLFETISKILVTKEGPVLLTDRSVLILSEGYLTELVSNSPTGFAFRLGEALIVQTDHSLLRIDAGGPKAITTPPRWNNITPVAVANNQDGLLILVTRRSGLFRIAIEGNSMQLEPLWDSLPAPLNLVSILSAAVLSDGSILLGTEESGLIHLDSDSSSLFTLDKRAGFRTGPIRAITVLQDESVMAFHDGGAIWLDISSGIRIWNAINGLTAPVISVATDDMATYAGTEDGIYKSLYGHQMGLIAEAGPGPIKILKRFSRSDIQGHMSLLIGKSDGLYEFYDDRLELVLRTKPNAVHISNDQPSRIAVASGAGIVLLDFEIGNWQPVGVISTLGDSSVQDLTEASNGILLATYADGTVKAFSPEQWLDENIDLEIIPLSVQHSLSTVDPETKVFFAGQGSHIRLFSTGLPLVWSELTNTFSRNTELRTVLINDLTPWVSATVAHKKIWAQTQTGGVIFPFDKEMSIANLPLWTSGTSDYGVIWFDDMQKRVLVGSSSGLYQLPENITSSAISSTPQAKLAVRQIKVDSEIIYDGNGPFEIIDISSENAVIEISLASLTWGFSCKASSLFLTKVDTTRPLINAPLNESCKGILKGAWQGVKQGQYDLWVKQKGKESTLPLTLRLTTSEPWFSRMGLPVTLGLITAMIASYGHITQRRVWPEPIVRYLALLSGLLLLWAAGIRTEVITSSQTPKGVTLQLTGLVVAAFVIPFVVDMLMRLSTQTFVRNLRQYTLPRIAHFVPYFFIKKAEIEVEVEVEVDQTVPVNKPTVGKKLTIKKKSLGKKTTKRKKTTAKKAATKNTIAPRKKDNT